MKDDINAAIQKCVECSRSKTPSKQPKAPLGDMRVGAPMDRLSTDIIGVSTPNPQRKSLHTSCHRLLFKMGRVSP